MKTITLISLCTLLTINVCVAQQAIYDVSPGDGNGLRFWSSNYYKIHMGNTAEYHFGPVTDYSIKMNMSNDVGRGWTWGYTGSTPIAALSNIGDMQVAGSFFTGSNVGVGTSSPSNIQGWQRVLDVRGGTSDAKIIATNSSNYITGLYTHSSWYGGGGFVGTESNHNLHLITNYSPKVSILTNGNVGIGTTTPDVKLNVVGDMKVNGVTSLFGDYSDTDLGASWSSTIWVRNNNALTNTFSRLSFVSGTDGLGAISVKKTGAVTGDMHFQVRNGGGYFQTPMLIKSDGNIGIGTTNPTQKLTVNGTIYGKEVKVDLSVPGPDYVFDEDYQLTPLEDIKTYIDKNKRLPKVPSAKEMEKNGIQLGEMNMLLLRKIEELTLYIIDQRKELDELKQRSVSPDPSGKKMEEMTLYMIDLKKENELLKTRIEKIENKK